MTTRWPCLSLHDGVPWLALSVQPNARRTAVDGLHDGALRIRLAAPPVDGKANAALMAWLADALGCPKRAVTLVRGQTGRSKSLAIDLPEQRVVDWLDGLAAMKMTRSS